MATSYGGGGADFAVKGGLVLPGAQFTVWDALTAGTQYTADLQDGTGGAIAAPYYVTADANGMISFRISSNPSGPVYVIAVGAPPSWGRVRMEPADMATRVAAASSAASSASGTATAASAAVAALTASKGAASGLVAFDASTIATLKNAADLDAVGADPATPSGALRLFARGDSGLYVKDSSGAVALVSRPGLTSSLTGAGVTVANSAVETVLASFSVPGGDMRVGSVYEMVLYGLGSTFSTAPTISPKIRLTNAAGTILAQSSFAAATSVSTTNQPCYLKAYIQCITLGVTGTVRAWGEVLNGMYGAVADTNPANRTFLIRSTTDTTVDTTGSLTFCMTWLWGTANAANTATFARGHIRKII